jgi:hypothetical protein
VGRVGRANKIHGLRGTTFYKKWVSMKTRCNNSKSPSYVSYGGRGIAVCERWKTFGNFMVDMYESYLVHCSHNESTTIERVDVNGNYEPKNCRWATWQEQYKNKRNTKKRASINEM